MAKMAKAVLGQRFGCSDGGKPETHSNYELSRLYDACRAADVAGLDLQGVFLQAPTSMKLDYNWSRWTYVAE